MTDLPPPSSEPTPPRDLEEQAARVRNTAEATAVGLFATTGALTAADIRLVEQIARDLAIALTETTLLAAQAGGAAVKAASVLAIAKEIADAAASPAALAELTEMVESIRKANAAAPARQVGELSQARESARRWTTFAYGHVVEDVISRLPGWEEFGLVLKKTWVSQGDSRVRPLHRRLHGKTAPVTGDFWRWPATGQKLRFPGDPLAPLDATMGCRCLVWLSWSAPGALSEAVRTLPPMEELP